MQKVTLLILLSFFALSSTLAQSQLEESGRFLKRIENRYANSVIMELPDGRIAGIDNLEGKSEIENRIFGDFNADVEYFFNPSFRPISAFRIYRDSLNGSYLLEVKKMMEQNGTIESKIVRVSDAFFEKIHATTFIAIDTFRAKGKPLMVFDGETATFRCVTEDEVWMLTIHMPTGYVERLSNLFRQMITDIEANQFDEVNYIELLDKEI